MKKTVDGFPIISTISFLPDEPDPTLNPWSYGKTIKIEVWGDLWYNLKHGKYARTIEWKGVSERIIDFELFALIIKGWMNDKWNPMTKEQAFDLWFEMSPYVKSR